MSAIPNLKDRLYVATFSQDALSAAEKYGVGLEINHTCISEKLDSDSACRENLLNEIRRDVTKASASSLVFHGPFTEIHPAAIDYRARELALERLNQAFDVAAVFGVKDMVVHTGWLPFIYFKEWQAEKSAEFWQAFMADKPEDFHIYIENVLEDEPYMLEDMMKRIDDCRIRLCIDIGHAHAMTERTFCVEDWIKLLAPYIGHFHLHNNNGTVDSHGTFEDGSMNMESIFSVIGKHCRPDVTFTIESAHVEPCLQWFINHKYI